MPILVVAGLSARMLAEAAANDGWRVVALDLFGDADTRRAAASWRSIGQEGALRIDATRVLDALQAVAEEGDAVGWIAGSGFEGLPEVLDAGARVLPLIGTPADAVRRVRDPARFFGALAAHGIAYPPVCTQRPADLAGWLLKDACGSGGRHIRQAGAHDGAGAVNASPGTSPYFQRAQPGQPMSATFIANGSGARVLGFNELLVRPLAGRPYVYCGCVGPVPVSGAVARQAGEAVRVLTSEFALRGWCSLDFLCEGESIHVLEVNPRPPDSMALYAAHGLVDAQLRACLQGELPSPDAFVPRGVSGHEIVHARRACRVDALAARRLGRWPDAHDLPSAGSRFAAGDPVCSLTETGRNAGQVAALLAAGRDALLHTLETLS